MKAIKFIPIIFLIVSFPLTGQTQDRHFERDCDDGLICSDFERILNNIIQYLDNGEGDEAFKELKALEACDKCPEHRDNIDSLSNDIVQLFARKNQELKEQNEENDRQRAELQRTITRLDRVLLVNEKTTREALVNNYILRLAQDFYEEQEDEMSDLEVKQNALSKALWLTDFTYNYVDSTHHEVKKMLYGLCHDRLQDQLPDEYFLTENTVSENQVLVQAVEASPDGFSVAVGLSNGRLFIFDGGGQVEFVAEASGSPITALTWEGLGDHLAFLSDGGDLRFVDKIGDRWELSNVVIPSGSSILTMAWSPMVDSLVAAGTTGGDILLFDLSTETLSKTLTGGHQDWVRDLAWSPDGRRIVACDDTGAVLVWDWTTERVVHEFSGHSDYARTVDWHPEGDTIISGGDDYELIFWDTTGQELDTERFPGWVYRARYNFDGSRIGVISGDSYFDLDGTNRYDFDLPTGIKSFTWLGHQNTVPAIDRRQVGFDDGAFFRVDPGPFSNMVSENITAVRWSPDGRYLAYSKGTSLVVLSEGQFNNIDLEGTQISSIAWRPLREKEPEEGYVLAAGLNNNEVLRLDVEEMKVQYVEMDALFLSLDWSPDGRQLAGGTNGGELVILNDQLQEEFRISPHRDYIRAVAWSPTGEFIATGSDDRTVGIVNVAQQEVQDRLSGHSDWVRAVCWLDDRHLVSASDDSRSVVWRYPREQSGAYNTSQSGRVNFPQYLEDLNGYLYSLSYFPFPRTEGGLLAVGSGGNQVGLYRVGADFKVELDTILEQPNTVESLSWRPGVSFRPLLSVNTQGFLPKMFEVGVEIRSKDPFPRESLRLFERGYRDMQDMGAEANNKFYIPRLRMAPLVSEQLAWSADERLLAIINSAKAIEIHDMEAAAPWAVFRTAVPGFERLMFSPNDKYLVAISNHEDIHLRQLAPSIDSFSFTITQEVADWAWSADSRCLYILDKDYGVHRFDTELSEHDYFPNELISNPEGIPGRMVAHPKDPTRIFVLNRQYIYEFRPQDGSMDLVYEGVAYLFNRENSKAPNGSWLQNGQRFVFEQEGSGPQFLQVQKDELRFAHQAADPYPHYAWADTPGSALLEIYPVENRETYDKDDRSSAQIYDVETREVIQIVAGVQNQSVQQLEVTDDGKFFATLGPSFRYDEDKDAYEIHGESYVSLWEIETQEEIMRLEVPKIVRFEFSPQGSYLSTYHDNGRLGIWPINIGEVSQYMENQGKDDFLRRTAGKNIGSFEEQIDEWQLQEGLEFRSKVNLPTLQSRERSIIREYWSKYYVDRAWLTIERAAKEEYFAKAIAIHQLAGDNRIVPTRRDSLALANVYMERAYDGIKEAKQSKANSWLQKVRSISLTKKRLAAFQSLLAWQDADGAPVADIITCLLDASCQTALQAEHKNWKTRRLHINDEVTLERIMALGNAEIDVVSPIRPPFIQEILAPYPADQTDELLFRYYSINNDHPALADDKDREVFLRDAARFIEDRFEKIQSDEQALEEYLGYAESLQEYAADKEKWSKAFEWAGKRLKTIRILLDLDPTNYDRKQTFLYTFGVYQKLNLQLNPEEARSVIVAINKLFAQYPEQSKEVPYLKLQKGHAELLAGQYPQQAMATYYSLLTDERYSFDNVASVTYRELELMQTNLLPEVKGIFADIRSYHDANSSFLYEREQLPPFTAEELADVAERLKTHRELYETASDRVNSFNKLSDSMDFSDTDEEQLKADQEETLTEYAYVALLASDWSVFRSLANQASLDYRSAEWPVAYGAIVDLLDEDWPAAHRKIREMIGQPNDGVLQERYPLLTDFLADLPASVKNTPQYQEMEKRWLDAFDE